MIYLHRLACLAFWERIGRSNYYICIYMGAGSDVFLLNVLLEVCIASSGVRGGGIKK